MAAGNLNQQHAWPEFKEHITALLHIMNNANPKSVLILFPNFWVCICRSPDTGKM
jgi:hypothetical protein